MFGLPTGKGVMAFSDTAGANSCLSLAFMLVREGEQLPYLYTNNPNFISNDWGLPVNFLDNNEVPEDLTADYLFTGTSHPDSSKGFELRFIRLAKDLNIYSLSFIDHWVNFLARFVLEGKSFLPDQIWILDEGARKLALKEDLPEDRLIIHPNPYQLFLKKYWRTSFYGKSYFSSLGINTENKHILFAPDPLSLRVGKEVAGFTEAEALQDLLEIMSENFSDQHLIIKCHPLQPDNSLLEVSNRFPLINSYLIHQADTPELIYAADVVIGFYSNILLEAAALGKKVIRYFPGKWEEDLFRHNTSLSKACRNTKELAIEMKKLNYG